MGSLQQNITSSCPANYTGGVGDGQPCTVNITDFGIPDISTIESVTVLVQHLNDLRQAINDEESRRQGSETVFGEDVNETFTVRTVHWVALKDALDTLDAWTNTYPGSKSGHKSFTWTYTPSVNDKISGVFLHDVKDKINDAENDCLCDCNYCTCNCDYCTCDCDYCACDCDYSCTCDCDYSCTCNCDYTCACDCNYSCTCDCNYDCNGDYSDMRLKKNVQYI